VQSIPRNPIVNTDVLFDFLLWQFSVSFKMPTLSSKLRYLINDFYRESVRWYFAFAKPIATCPEVIAEIHGHAEGVLRGHKLGNFWSLAKEQLTELRLNEKLVELIQMDGDILSSLGPTDTALLHLSRQIRQPVLTADGKLANKCRSWELPVLSITEILAYWQQHETG